MSFLLKSDLIKNEEHRINYVAVSRAIKRLFISVPSLIDKNKKKLEKFNITTYLTARPQDTIHRTKSNPAVSSKNTIR